MDKIWDRNPSKSEVIGRCGGDGKTEWPRRTDKSQTLKKSKKQIMKPRRRAIMNVLFHHGMSCIWANLFFPPSGIKLNVFSKLNTTFSIKNFVLTLPVLTVLIYKCPTAVFPISVSTRF